MNESAPRTPTREIAPEGSRYASRKLIVCLLGMALATWLRARGLLADDPYATIMVTGMIGYPAANVLQKWVTSTGAGDAIK